MSPFNPKPSSSGTPLPERTVGELVTEQPKLSRVFQAFEIDLCCDSELILRQVCENKGLELRELLAAFERECVNAPPPADAQATLPLSELTAYIVGRHHDYLRCELPRIHTMAERAARVHCATTPSLVEVYLVFTEMGEELARHMQKEEQVLFPLIAGLEKNETHPDILRGPVSCMLEEHDDTHAALTRLGELTHSYEAPAEACNTYRALFARLSYLEADTRQHIHLENDILFPRALEWAS